MKYFITSDIHSFYTPLKTELDKSGFDINNSDHILIICGDIFDRGDETIELYNFLISIPKDRLILIKGNHEYLFEELTKKALPQKHDWHNGTVKTFCQIADILVSEVEFCEIFDRVYWSTPEDTPDYKISEKAHSLMSQKWSEVKKKVKKSDIYKFIKSYKWLNYYEVGNYICVHSYIPLIKDWRNACCEEWKEATWQNPWLLYKNYGDPEEGKTLVCGHWHTSDFYKNLDGDLTKSDCPIYNNGIIALDACTALTNRTNILIIEV